MYETFGAGEIDESRRASFRVFIPDAAIDPSQYSRGGPSRIASITAVGDFQEPLGGTNWKAEAKFKLQKTKFKDPADGRTKGWLYELVTDKLPEGFYQYKYEVTFEGTDKPRVVCDPCTRYGGQDNQNSAFVVGGPDMKTEPLANPLPLEELIIYELMIDDFTASFRQSRAPLDAINDKLDHIQKLGINAIEFMPWMQWPGSSYSWGYDPQDYFAVAYRYTLDPAADATKLFYLKRLISECHKRNIHVLLDGVFDHVTNAGADGGFGYKWLWRDPNDSPYCGNFAGTAFGQDLDYANACVLEYIFDVCRYWIETFSIDGIRFDYTLGFYDPARPKLGLPALLAWLGEYLKKRRRTTFPLILEHEWDYSSVGVANTVRATSCWLDPFRGRSREYMTARRIRSDIMRLLDSGRDFDAGRTPTTYFENHDHESFMVNAGSREEWWRAQPYIIALLTCAGAPLIHNGQEFAEMYRMPEDDFGAPADTEEPAFKRVVPRPLRWERASDGPGTATYDLYKRLIEIRRTHPGLTSLNFHPRFWDENNTEPDANGFGVSTSRQTVVFHRWGNAGDGRLERFYVVLNFSQWNQPVSLSFPEDDGWVDLLSGWRPAVRNNWLTFEVGSNWGHVFYKKY